MQEVRSKAKRVSRERRREIRCMTTGMKTLLASVVILTASFITDNLGNLVFAQKEKVSIKLFGARPTFGTGPVTSPKEAIPFASTSLILSFAPEEDTAVISSTPDGAGSIAVDNFMTINGVNACEEAPDQVSCFGPIINPDLPTGVPIKNVLTPISPIDVSKFIPVGTNTVVFELRDFGEIAGNTNLFLVTTATVTPEPPPPPTAARAFDRTVALCKNRLISSALETFGDASRA